jgi:hypothetical protein
MRLLIAVVLLLTAPWPSSAQPLAPASPVATLSPAEMEKFLLDGRIVKKKEGSKGVTEAYRVTLSDGALTHDAQVQNVGHREAVLRCGSKEVRGQLQGFVPLQRRRLSPRRAPRPRQRADVSRAHCRWKASSHDVVARRRHGRWRPPQEEEDPQSNPARAADYYSVMFVFDELIQNRDRNQGNIVWSPDSKMWLIDHTRAFRLGRDLQTPGGLTRIERSLFEKLRALDRQAFTESVGKSLTKDEVEALFVRRDKIVKLFDEKIKVLGEDKVLFTIR